MPRHHITGEERVKIEMLWREGYAKNAIADALGRHRSSIGRELERNFAELFGMTYRAKEAEHRRKKVRTDANATLRKLVPGSVLTTTVEEGLRNHWSPEQVAGRLRRDHGGKAVICHETIYRHVYGHRRELISFLRHGRKRRYRRRHGTKIREKRREEAKKKRIDARPKIVERRERVGDWEGDTIVGKEQTIHVLTHVDRKSGFLFADKLQRATAEATRKATTKRFRRLPKKKRCTVTYDNGVQFAEHETLERDLKLPVYFAYPYHSWERGTNENTNGLLRQFLPKRSSFAGLQQRTLDGYVKLINTRPRKRLDYRTPEEVFNG